MREAKKKHVRVKLNRTIKKKNTSPSMSGNFHGTTVHLLQMRTWSRVADRFPDGPRTRPVLAAVS